jgi:hypothetical protein
MINSQIIKIVSDSKNFGLKNIFTHKSIAKNSLCGDLIKIEIVVKFIIKKNKKTLLK